MKFHLDMLFLSIIMVIVIISGLLVSYYNDITELCITGNTMLDELYSHRLHFPDTVEHIQSYSEQLEQRCN